MDQKDLGARPDAQADGLSAAPARKFWHAPQFMVSNIIETETGGLTNTDGSTLTAVQS
jgi:hypothetical protein